MKLITSTLFLVFTSLMTLSVAFSADADLTPEQKTKLEQRVADLVKLAADPLVVAAVKERNAKVPDELKTMTPEKWKSASILDPVVRSMGKNPVAALLKDKQASDAALSEAFVSAADGTKVAFISKPSNWTHKGKPKHDLPMQGKPWKGAVEVDDSSGIRQIQVAVPVMVDGKAAGSIVAGFQIVKL